MSLVWGVRAYYCEDYVIINDAIDYSTKFLKEKELIAQGDVIIHIGSIPMFEKGYTNMIKLTYV